MEYVRFQFEWSANIKIIDIKNASVVIVVVAAGVDVVSESWKDIIITIYCYYKSLKCRIPKLIQW